MDQSRKHIYSTILSNDETRDLAKQAAKNILAKMKGLGYPLPNDGVPAEQEEEEEEEAAGEQETQNQDDDEEEEEELIHMYSDEEEIIEPSLSTLDRNFN